MKILEVFDPAMCCATGVCGVEVDPVLAHFPLTSNGWESKASV
jgi:hypothetical protein